jgi:methionyl-tRNA synthetase
VQISYALSVLISPVMPDAGEALQKMLNLDKPALWDDVKNKRLPPGFELGKAAILFSKIEDDVIEKEIDKLNKIESSPEIKKTNDPEIEFEFFQKVVLKTAVVRKAESVKGADRLLKLQVDVGGESRQIVAGIAQDYSPGDVVGKTVIIVANLKPATIRGVTSQGMLLAVKSDKGLTLLTPDGDTGSGLRVS